MNITIKRFWRRIIGLLFAAVVMLVCTSCVQRQAAVTWRQAMHSKMSRYLGYSKNSLSPYLRRQHLTYPVSRLAILVLKKTKRLEVYAKNTGRWKYIRSYPVLAASGHAGPKLREGDYQVPEGVYHIVGLNPESRFDLSMRLNYPNQIDRQHARQDGRQHLGGEIYIHGDQRSVGCVAIGDKAIEQLFPLVYETGIENVTVIIAPNDLRYKIPHYRSGQPRWLPSLYVELLNHLEPFPLPNAVVS